MKKAVIIRADGGTSIGMGHVVRSLALADMIRADFDIVFAIQQPGDEVLKLIHSVTETVIHLPQTNDYASDAANFCHYLNGEQIVVLDGYHFRTEYQQEIRDKGCKTVAIDDLHAWHHVADLIINHADGIEHRLYSTEEYTRLCTGPGYVLLRREFLSGQKKRGEIKKVKKVFISMGAADINNRTTAFAESLSGIEEIEEIHLMLGTINPHLKAIAALKEKAVVKILTHININAEELAELLLQCDCIICPASSISLEASAIGIPMISGYTAENQSGILGGLLKHGAAISLGDMNLREEEELTARFLEIFSDTEKLNSLVKQQATMIDGKSPQRIRNLFQEL